MLCTITTFPICIIYFALIYTGENNIRKNIYSYIDIVNKSSILFEINGFDFFNVVLVTRKHQIQIITHNFLKWCIIC